MGTEPVRRVCFVTGTRAEFGLMRSTLAAIRDEPRLQLQIVATGMHLSKAHGYTVRGIRADGWTVDARVPWSAGNVGVQTGRATGRIAGVIERLQSDVVLVVGDRVEAFAAAAAGHLGGLIVAHVHGGDRALGQVDDALRHAITKLAHLHFPATARSAGRVAKLGEDRWRIHRVGSPGVDGIVQAADLGGPVGPPFALIVLHPTDADEAREYRRARIVLSAVRRGGINRAVIVYPNNDSGHLGIVRCWETAAGDATVHRDVPRPRFLALMRDAAVLIGNSSSGIIEAASFGTPVIDVGPRQQGREHGGNVVHVPFDPGEIEAAVRRVWQDGDPRRFSRRNVYGGDGAGRRIAGVLASVALDERLRRKLIAY